MCWLRLLRLRLLPSALCDILCGLALTGGIATGRHGEALILMAGSALLYVSGMAWNDVADAERDRERGARGPIASGEISRLQGALFSSLLMAAGLWVLWGHPCQVLVLCMALGILLYDFLGSRHLILGAPLLGLIRAGNLSLGILGMGAEPGLPPIFIAALYALYIALIVWHGSLEDVGNDTNAQGRSLGRSQGRSQALMLSAAPLPLLCAAFLPYGWLTLVAASPQLWLVLRFVGREVSTPAAGTGLLLRGISRFTAAVCLGTGQWLLAGLSLILAWLIPSLLGRIRWT